MKVTFLAACMLWAGAVHAQQPPTALERPHGPGIDASRAHDDSSGPGYESGAASAEQGATPQRSQESLPAPDLLIGVVQRPHMGLADFLELAQSAHPALNEAKALVERSQAQARQAGLYPNPSIGYQGDQIRGGAYGGGEQGAYLQQTIVLGGKLGLRREIYRQQSVADTIGIDEQTYRLRNDVTQEFYAALASQAAVAARKKLLGIALDAVETVHQLANVGQADVPDLLQTEVEGERAEVEYVEAQRQYLADFHRLAAVAGMPEQPPCPLDGDLEELPNLDPDRRAAEVAATSPALKRAQQQVAVAVAKLHDARRESVPDIVLRAGVQYSGEQVAEEPVPRAAGVQSFASAGITLPLWNRNQGNVAAAEADLERARQQVATTRLAIQEATGPFVQSYLAARFAADRYRTELLPRARTAYRLTLEKYQGMAQAYPQVLVSQRTLFELQIDYLHALLEVWRNAIALDNYGLSGTLTTSPANPARDSIEPIELREGGQE